MGTTVAVCRVCSCSEPCSAAAHVCQHPARQLCSSAAVSGSDGRAQSPLGVDDDAAEEKFAVGQPLAPAEQTEQQQQGLIHPGPGRTDTDSLTIMLRASPQQHQQQLQLCPVHQVHHHHQDHLRTSLASQQQQLYLYLKHHHLQFSRTRVKLCLDQS